MKDKKIKNIISAIITILVITFAILWYPWFVSNENGESSCHNIFGYTMKCR